MNISYEQRRVAELKAIETPQTFARFLATIDREAQKDIAVGNTIPLDTVMKDMESKYHLTYNANN
ncbi:MAG: hypothetical protein LBM77_05580 [Spirochaetaceae bacterium]|jgi:hypothetical protein|nr:hypothetical protein [Spirochaetaceae bacterium]